MAGQGAWEQEAGSESIGPLSLQAVRGSVGLSVAVQCIADEAEVKLSPVVRRESEIGLIKNKSITRNR